jgi:transcriptional regulator with XRE-family HTH domain
MDYQIFQQAIRKAIIKYQLHEYLATSMGVSPKTVTRWVNGTSSLPLEILEKLGEHPEANLALTFSAHKLFRKFGYTPYRPWKLRSVYRFQPGNNSIAKGKELLEAFEVALHPIKELSMKLLSQQGGEHPQLSTLLSSAIQPVEIEPSLDCSGWKYELPDSYQAECGLGLKELINQNLLSLSGMDLRVWWQELMAIGELEHSPILYRQIKESLLYPRNKPRNT